MARKDAVARPEPVNVTVAVPQPAPQGTNEIPAMEKLNDLLAVKEHVLRLVYTEPTEPGAQHAIAAYDEAGNMITYGQGEDFEDAYLDIGDKLDPNLSGE